MKHRLALIVALIAGGVAVAAAIAAERAPEPPQRIAIAAENIDAFDPRDASARLFGALQFRGGLVLKSTYKEFGGLSALHLEPDGQRFLAVSDHGYWLRGAIVYRDQKPAAIADAEMALILGPDGRPLNRRGWYDTESLAVAKDAVYVGIERVNEIVRFDYRGQGFPGLGQPIAAPPGIKTLPHNKGLECLTMPDAGQPYAGTLIAVSERGLDRAGNIRGFLVGPPGGTFSVKRTDEFDVSDCTVTPRGDLLLLERRFTWTRGIAMRIRRVPLANLKPDALLDGPQLVFADMGYQIDNMEGIAVHRAADGALVLTLISDDNFSIFQRTLLLQFTLMEE